MKKTKGKLSRSEPLKRPRSAEMCPPGFHVVQGHERTCKSGTKTWVDEHIRSNPGKIRPGLLKENIHYLFWHSKKKYGPLPDIKTFESIGAQYDSLIQFWLDYWKSQGLKFPADLDALLIKALIAKESSFIPGAESTTPGSTAAGLMQVTDQTLRVVGGFPNKAKWVEARDHLLHIEPIDKFDPVVNVALGTRVLAHKFSQIPKRYPKDARSTLIGYHSFNKDGEDYADKILDSYRKSKRR